MRRLLLVLTAVALLGADGPSRDALERLEVELLHADEQLRGATARVRELEARLATGEAELEELEARLEERQEHLGARLRAMYRMRHRGFLPLLFSARSPHELLRNARSLWWIVRADQDALDGFADERDRAEALRDQLDTDRSALLQRAGEVYARREDARVEQTDLRAQLGTTVTGPRRTKTLIVQEAPTAVDVKLDGRVEQAPELVVEELTPASTFTRNKGLLPMPATGTIEPSGRGIDILAPGGAAIRSVADGTVSKVLTIRGFGLVAIVNHGDGWHTVYGHASVFGVAAGERVHSGQILGSVGQSGTDSGDRLHFEIRNAQQAEDPLDWLKVPPGVRIRR